MGWWDDVKKVAEATPVIGTAVAPFRVGADLASGKFSQAGQAALEGVPGVGTLAATASDIGGPTIPTVTKGKRGGGGQQQQQPTTTPTQQSVNPQSPIYDPLALQTIFSTVFAPYLKQIQALNTGTGQDYLTAMQNLISGVSEPANQKAQQEQMAQANAALLGQEAKTSLSGVAATPAYDQLIATLQQAAGAATQAQGEAQKNIAYGTNYNAAQAFGSGGTGSTAGLSPNQASTALQQALTGGSTGTPATSIVSQPPTGAPGSPVKGQQYSVGGVTYTWDGANWIAQNPLMPSGAMFNSLNSNSLVP